MNRLLLALLLAYFIGSSAQDESEQARTIYLGKQVTMVSALFHPATEEAGRYRAANASWISEQYSGKTATVVAIQTKQPSAPAKVNALGEVVQPQVAHHEFEFVIKFADGLVAIRSDSLGGIKQWLRLPEEIAAKEAEEKANEVKTQQLIGKAVFATAMSSVYRPDVTVAEMQHRNRIPVPSMVPLPIRAAKWHAGTGCAVIKVELPDGGSGLSLLALDKEPKCDGAFLLTAVPSYLSKAEIAAIQKHSVVRGMGTMALYYSIGYPDKENDWGRGGKQLIYSHGLYVYTDNNDQVVDWQKLSEP